MIRISDDFRECTARCPFSQEQMEIPPEKVELSSHINSHKLESLGFGNCETLF